MNDQQMEPTEESVEAQTLWNRLWMPCDVASVAFFRIAFGLVVLWHVGRYLWGGSLEYFFGRPAYHLTYFGFEWVQALDLGGMRRVYYLMGIAAIGVSLGCLYRVSAALLFLTFTYAFLAEAAQFQNHYYLISLVAFLLILVPAHRSFSVDAVLVPAKASSWIPNWCRWLLMFQIAVPYVYGGIAKMNGDWLHAIPAIHWFPRHSDLPLVGPLLAEPTAAWFISYFGLIFDLLVVPLLLWRRTRVFAFVLALCFHLSNAVLFRIDVFPYMMILATTILFSAGWPRRVFRLAPLKSDDGDEQVVPKSRFLIGGVAVFVIWQIVFPFRHILYPGDPSWTDEGQEFAWRMMLRTKRVFFVVHATDGPSRRMVEIAVDRLMTPKQLYRLGESPYQLVSNAAVMAESARKEFGFQDVEIRAFVLTSLNGRKPQLQIDPDVDLLTIRQNVWSQEGIIPLKEPRRTEQWSVPVAQWANALDIQPPVSDQ